MKNSTMKKYEEKINIGISKAINGKNGKLYVKEVKKAILYFLDNKLSLDTLDSIGAAWLPYMKISKKYAEILMDIAALEIVRNPKKLAKECLDALNRLDKKLLRYKKRNVKK